MGRRVHAATVRTGLVRSALARTALARTAWVAALFVVGFGLSTPQAFAGGGAENALVIIDPSSAASLYVGNHYVRARGLPAQNVLYLSPGASDFAAFADYQRAALLGVTANRRTLEHIDYVVATPGGSYFVNAPNLVSDGCYPVTRFSASSVFTFAFVADDILQGSSFSSRRNQYYSSTNALHFSSGTRYLSGLGGNDPDGERYFIGALLGYDGPRGNTLEETIAMIDRGVAIDGTHPDGTFYFMRTTDELRSGPRHNHFPRAIQAILDLGGQAEQIDDVLPLGRHDALGIMTGWATPDIDGGDFSILPGAMCDHLTSYAGTFDDGGQTKLSRWIPKGAAGSYGTVEEPCNYPGKFPHPFFHVWYYSGLTLGEAGLRSLSYTPFQVLAYGDPLTQPFAYIPSVDVPDAPTDEVSGVITLTPQAQTDRPGGGIDSYDLLVGGVTRGTVIRRGEFTLDTAALPDGPNDVRVVAYDNSPMRNQGRWLGTLHVNNRGQAVSLAVSPDSGDRSTLVDVTVEAAGGAVREIRVMQNGRVLASTGLGLDTVTVRAEAIGAGVSQLYAEADFETGGSAVSELVEVSIAYANPPATGGDTVAPTAFGYTRAVSANRAMLVELPAFDPDDPAPTIQISGNPSQATVQGSGAARLIKPDPRASGTDTLTFQAISNGRPSNTATITLVYGSYVPCDGIVKWKANCKRGKIKLIASVATWDDEGGVLTATVDAAPHELTIENRKAKLILTGQSPGAHTVTLTDPPGCRAPVVVNCE